jgi:hypothetical protein
LAGNLAFVLLAGTVITFMIVAATVARRIPTGSAASASSATSAAATANAGSGWIPLVSQAPGAIIAAARKSTLFNVDRSGKGDYLKDLSHLENPELVRAVAQPGSASMPDYYVIPIDDASGRMVGAAELALSPTDTAVQLTAIITYSTPRRHGQLAQIPETAALSDLSRQRVALRGGAQPELVYIPIDAAALETGEITWNGGGEYPADPVWAIPGADGKDHVVGTDNHVYATSDLPVMKQP